MGWCLCKSKANVPNVRRYMVISPLEALFEAKVPSILGINVTKGDWIAVKVGLCVSFVAGNGTDWCRCRDRVCVMSLIVSREEEQAFITIAGESKSHDTRRSFEKLEIRLQREHRVLGFNRGNTVFFAKVRSYLSKAASSDK